MTFTNGRIGGIRQEVDESSAGRSDCRVADDSQRDGLADLDWQKEVEHSARVAKAMLTHLTSLFPKLFSSRDVPWHEATDEDAPR